MICSVRHKIEQVNNLTSESIFGVTPHSQKEMNAVIYNTQLYYTSPPHHSVCTLPGQYNIQYMYLYYVLCTALKIFLDLYSSNHQDEKRILSAEKWKRFSATLQALFPIRECGNKINTTQSEQQFSTLLLIIFHVILQSVIFSYNLISWYINILPCNSQNLFPPGC